MLRRWSVLLEWLGRLRFRTGGVTRMRVGDPEAVDAAGGGEWRRFTKAEPLYDVWGPHPDGPWVPFHSVPLFAALDRLPLRAAGPATAPRHGDGDDPRNWVPSLTRPLGPRPEWLTPGTWTVLDLPGPAAVETAVWLIAAGCQPVCTFDNWPHPQGVLRAEATLAELIRWASTVEPLRERIRPDSLPLWICDSQRLGTKPGTPGQFDNRYYLDDSTLPGTRLLAGAGIRRVVYVTLRAADVPVLDFEAYFVDLLAAGIAVEHIDLSVPGALPRPFAQPSTPRRVQTGTFRRSAAGGFGTEVPQPSSGGG